MKQCPKCQRCYLDTTLNFCLEDGDVLHDYIPIEDFPTEVMPHAVSEPQTRFFPSSTVGEAVSGVSAARVPANSIAVLPFAHLSSAPDDEYFCDGLAEELINALAKIDGLKIAARTSAFRFKDKNIDIGTIGRQLGVETVLDGSVRKAGNRLRITAQLVGTADGYHLWSERYDREMRDIFEIQDEISHAVVAALKAKLLGEDETPSLAKLYEELRHYRADVEAYQLYLRGRFSLNKFTAPDAFRAIELFNEAIALDPRLAAAYAGLADANIMSTEMGPVPAHEAMPRAKEAALKALELDDTLAEAHSSLGMVLQDYDYDFLAAEARFMRAIELSPNSPIPRQSYGILLTELGRHEEAEVQFGRLLEVDPLSVVGNWIYSFCLFLARRYDDSLVRAEQCLDLDPNFGVAYLTVAFAYQMKGDHDKSVEAYARCSEVMGFPENAIYIRESYKNGWKAFLTAMASRDRPSTFSSYIVAVFAATLGDLDRAIEELEASLAKRESHIVMMNVDPRFDGMRADERFQQIIRTVGFPPIPTNR